LAQIPRKKNQKKERQTSPDKAMFLEKIGNSRSTLDICSTNCSTISPNTKGQLINSFGNVSPTPL